MADVEEDGIDRQAISAASGANALSVESRPKSLRQLLSTLSGD
jgi:hypothetical protein